MIQIDLTKKLKRAMLELDFTQTKLAERSGQTQKNLSNKMARNDFKLSEYQRLVEALGCTLDINIVLPTGEKV